MKGTQVRLMGLMEHHKVNYFSKLQVQFHRNLIE